MATKEKDTNKELEVEEIVSKSEQFIENNSKKIIYGIIAVALVVGAVLGIKRGNHRPIWKHGRRKLGEGLRRYLLLQDGRYTEGARFIEIFQRKGPNGISGGYRLDR